MKKLSLFVVIISILALLANCSSGSNGGNGGDETPPVISQISVSNITETGVDITWATDENSTSQVEYGTTTSYGSSSSLNTALLKSQIVNLSGLDANTTYHYRVISKDADGNETVSEDKTFTTSSASAAEQWAAYDFDQTVSPASGASGMIDTFTIEETYVDEGETRRFEIEGEYLGKVTANIKTFRYDVNTYQTTTVTTPVECYKIKHRITVLQAPTGDDNPDWADLTVYIPASEFETTATYFWIYPMATYSDSDGHTGEWGFYLTQAMQDEIDEVTATYYPYMDGDFYSFDSWALFGLYGWAWTWFGAYTTEGDDYLEEGSWSYGGYNYSCTLGTEAIGSYSFDAWNLTIAWSYGEDSGEYEGIFSPDLPLPIYLKIGNTSEGSENYFEYDLTELELE
jgi:hypothetical protein